MSNLKAYEEKEEDGAEYNPDFIITENAPRICITAQTFDEWDGKQNKIANNSTSNSIDISSLKQEEKGSSTYKSGGTIISDTYDFDDDDGVRIRGYADGEEDYSVYGPFMPALYDELDLTADHPWGYFEPKSKTGYVGLSNQGATCYMNSLLQTLFMTPEFLQSIYEWRYNPEKDGEEPFCIPYQLQKLFSNLQSSERPWIETKDLTHSFGWSNREAFQQHDVQELNRVLMDALETTFAGTPSASKIQDLYKGVMTDYIHCEECKHTRQREEIFMDISLVIRNCKSVQQSLSLFVEPEHLNGSNQYSCERCQKKVDALKGLALKELPYLLTLQLKRFDFDYETFERIKLNDEVSFPMTLDMTPYLQKPMDDEKKAVEVTSANNMYELFSVLVHQGSGAGGGHYFSYIKSFETGEWYTFNDSNVFPLPADAIKNAFGGTPTNNNNNNSKSSGSQSEKENSHSNKADVEMQTVEPVDVVSTTNEILIRANGSMEEIENWESEVVNVNVSDPRDDDPIIDDDDMVQHPTPPSPSPTHSPIGSPTTHQTPKLPLHLIPATATHSPPVKVSTTNINSPISDPLDVSKLDNHSSSKKDPHTPLKKSCANAYMLMYRKIDPSKNLRSVSKDQLPPAMRELIREENRKYLKEKEEYLLKRDTIKLRVAHSAAKSVIHTFAISKKRTLKEATEEAYKMLKISELHGLPIDCVRLRSYSAFTGVPGETYFGKESKTLEELFIYNLKDLLLETKQPHEKFPEYNADQIMLRIFKWNAEAKDNYDPPVDIFVDKKMTLFEFKILLSERFNLPADHIRVWELRYVADLMTGDHKKLSSDFGLVDGDKLHIEYALEPDDPKDSMIYQNFERQKYIIEIKFNLPDKPEDFSQSIEIDRRFTMRSLKEAIQKVVNLPLDGFRIRRASSTVYEFKDDNQTLQHACLYDSSKVVVERGKPLAADYYWMKFYGGIRLDNTSQSSTSITSSANDDTYIHLFDHAVKGDVIISDLKNILLTTYPVEFSNLGLNEVTHVRLREKLGNHAGKIFKNHKSIKQCVKYLYDGKEAIIEKTAIPEDLKDREVMVILQRYYPATRTYSIKQETIVHKHKSAKILRDIISEISGIAPNSLLLSTPYWAESPAPDATQWEKIADLDDRTVTQVMSNIKDGELILYKDENEEAVVEPQKDASWTNSRLYPNTSTSNEVLGTAEKGGNNSLGTKTEAKPRPKEVGIKIRTRNTAPQNASTNNATVEASDTTVHSENAHSVDVSSSEITGIKSQSEGNLNGVE